jgi:pimeloyl-ACP methyl ester carboxylesterase
MKKLLLLHGALGAKSQFAKLEALLSNRFEVHLMDFTGHGLNDIPEVPFSIEMFSGDIESWINENSTEPVNIFGYSMGGYVALHYAKYNPGKIDKIFTLATKFEWTPAGAAREAKMLDAAKIKEKAPRFAEDLSARHGAKWEKILEKTAEMMMALGNRNVLQQEDLSGIECEVLIGIGDRDKMVTIEESVAAYRLLKNGKLLVIPDTPHPFEQAEASRLAFEINEFME